MFVFLACWLHGHLWGEWKPDPAAHLLETRRCERRGCPALRHRRQEIR